MAYNNLISRGDVFIPEKVTSELIAGAIEQSAALSLFPRITISSKVTRLPVLSALPVAYFVSGDTGLKQTTELNWGSKTLDVEELAVIVPVPDAVLEDADFDIWGEVKPRLVESIGRALDAAIFFGTNKPASWPTAIVPAAITAGNLYYRGLSAASAGGIAEDVNQLMATVEADGFDVNGFITARNYRSRLRSARDTTGQKLLDMSLNEIEGAPVKYVMAGQWPSTGDEDAEMILGDFTEGILGVRRDFSFKFLDQAVITDNTGAVIYNLPQQDMVAMRVTFRVAWQVSNAINYYQQTEASRYPFGVMLSPNT